MENGALLRQEAVPVTVTDATGAGDALTAALVVGLAYDMPLPRCAQLGVSAAGVTISRPGSVTEALRDLVKE